MLLPDPQLWNYYSYSRNNPVMYKDDSGGFVDPASILLGIYVASVVLTAVAPVLPAVLENKETVLRNAPLTGDAIDIGESFTGKNIFTNEKLSTLDRTLTIGAMFLPVVSGKIARKVSKMIPSIKMSKLSRKVQEVVEQIRKKGVPFDNYSGNGKYKNSNNLLPDLDDVGKQIDYKEWDVDPKIKNQKRNAERIITGSDGSMYYTDEHYENFNKIEE